ncbi:MAG: Alpha-amylase-family protein [Hyphomicrobiales bacterium]|nr:Alpha-amylase-family protein [Hyphomicrobiales bacterium]
MNQRAFPVGAEIVGSGVSFRVFADSSKHVDLCLAGRDRIPMVAEGDGYFSILVPDLEAGARYRYRLDGGQLLPDPASRFQPDGPHGDSALVDASAFAWTDGAWEGCRIDGQVIYEMHVGTFTPEGTWAAAMTKLPHLAETGITLIEMMPVSCFPGAFGWGYDGVLLFAPVANYGAPDDLRRFIDAAHALGIGVIHDVVYNHLGPDGNYLAFFSKNYVTERYTNDWGAALNFDGEGALPMREYVVANARYWIEEFHFDGLRLDATQSIHDASSDHVIAEVVRVARQAARPRNIVIVGENEPQDARLVRPPSAGGYGLDALWNDDFHHSAVVAATGRNPAYYNDHAGLPQEFISAAKHGFLFQGQVYEHQAARRGQPALDLTPDKYVLFTENHDQVANSATGRRLHMLTSPGRARALSAMLLLMPGTPMLFQGQEFGSTAPFFYFADHRGELADMVASGRVLFLQQFESMTSDDMKKRLPRPDHQATFDACKLDWSEAAPDGQTLAMTRSCLALRRGDGVLNGSRRIGVDGSVLAEEAFYLRYFAEDGRDRLLFFNLGRDVRRGSIPDPLVAPPAGCVWRSIWSSENPRFGGSGEAPVESDDGWLVPGQSAVVLAAVLRDQ